MGSIRGEISNSGGVRGVVCIDWLTLGLGGADQCTSSQCQPCHIASSGFTRAWSVGSVHFTGPGAETQLGLRCSL